MVLHTYTSKCGAAWIMNKIEPKDMARNWPTAVMNEYAEWQHKSENN